jgi:hypothetical protein
MHWCYEESQMLLAALSMLPFVGIMFKGCFHWFCNKLHFNKKCCKDHKENC